MKDLRLHDNNFQPDRRKHFVRINFDYTIPTSNYKVSNSLGERK